MKINIDQEYNGKEIYYKKEIKNFFAIIKQDLLNYSKKQNELFVEYFSKNAEGKRIGIVDIGWYGHMQESISSILKNNMLQKYKIIGFYMGITPRSKIYSVNEEDMHGFLYEPDKNEDIYIRLRESIAIFESCFLAHHGSVVGYVKNNNNSIGVNCEEIEYDKDEINKLEDFQTGALKWIEKGLGIFGNDEQFTVYSCVDEYMQMCINPSFEEAEFWGDLSFSDDNNYKIASPRSIKYYLKNLGAFFCDIKKSQWKIGFIKRLFKIPFDFGYIYIYMINMFRKRLKI